MRTEEFIKILKELSEVFRKENMIKENKKQLKKEIYELKIKRHLKQNLHFERIASKIHDRDTCFCDEIKE